MKEVLKQLRQAVLSHLAVLICDGNKWDPSIITTPSSNWPLLSEISYPMTCVQRLAPLFSLCIDHHSCQEGKCHLEEIPLYPLTDQSYCTTKRVQ